MLPFSCVRPHSRQFSGFKPNLECDLSVLRYVKLEVLVFDFFEFIGDLDVLEPLGLATFLNENYRYCITDSSSAITGTFSNGTNYTITVTVTNGYETAVATQTIARAFANVHMSGMSTGGVCFGGFSSATEGDPKFECYYPAYFYGGIHGSDAYEDGDVVTLTNGSFYGYVSNSSKSINFTVPLRKSLENISSATITEFKANIANSGGYGISSSFVTGGSSYMGSAITRTVKIYKETNCLEINLARSSAWDLTNNNNLSVRNESLVITLNA